ncbi:unnamed protein product [Ceratitis capitata]|uniref:(Mediterranean fruit fly) hypothetical protein n=1 Tax=Ceratitis capitata TaxID=7213 RepID=A0A811V0J7_CERCA|nr:unnamed protein product [Ceratitis capitata]
MNAIQSARNQTELHDPKAEKLMRRWRKDERKPSAASEADIERFSITPSHFVHMYVLCAYKWVKIKIPNEMRYSYALWYAKS